MALPRFAPGDFPDDLVRVFCSGIARGRTDGRVAAVTVTFQALAARIKMALMAR